MNYRQPGAGILRAAFLAILCFANSVLADPVAIDIPAQPLDTALTAFGMQTRLTVVADPALVRGKKVPAVTGSMEPAAALDALLKSSGLTATVQNGTVTLRKAQPRSESDSVLPEVAVTGSAETAAMPGDTPVPYAGGQVARGAQLGILGNRDFMDTPFSTTGYTADLIQNQQARTLADVMANDPSVRSFYSSSFPQDSFFIRGFSVDSGDFSSGGMYGATPLMRMSPALVERVEVLKGPSMLLNGTPPFGSVGGMVNVVPKRATDTPITQFTGSFASDAQFGGHLDIGRRFGPDGSIGVRFNGVYRNGDTSMEDNSQEMGDAVIGLDFRSESVRVALDLGYQRQHDTGIENSFFPIGTRIPDAPNASSHIFQPWLYFKGEDTFGAVRAELDLTQEVTLFAAVGARRNELEEVFGFGVLDSNGDFSESITPHAGYNETRTELIGARVKFATGPMRHDVSVNVSTLWQERGNFYAPPLAGPWLASNIYSPIVTTQSAIAPLPGDPPKESELDMLGFALSDAVSFGEKWTVIGGARMQRIKTWDFLGNTTSNDAKVSPAAGVVFRPVEQISLYANYIEGFSPSESFFTNANQLLPPSVSKQIEAGVKADFQRSGLQLSVFRIEQPQEIVDALGRWTLDGMQRNTGVELTVFGEPLRGVRLLGGAMFLDGIQEHTEGGLNDGNSALNAPELNINLGAEWDTPWAPGLTLSARMIHTDEQFADQANTLTIPDWTRFDLGARYTMKMGGKPVTLRAAVENVTDEAYWANSYLYRGAPRTYLLSATIDF